GVSAAGCGIELVPRVFRRDAGRVLDRVIAGAGHDVGDVRLTRGLGQHHVGAAAKQPGAAGRRDAEGARKGLPEDRRRLLALGDIDEIARQQLMLMEGGGVAVEPVLVLQPALDEIEGDLRQAPLRHAVQIFNIDGVIQSHRAQFSLKSATPAGVLRAELLRISPYLDNSELCRAGLRPRQARSLQAGGPSTTAAWNLGDWRGPALHGSAGA